MASKRVAWIRAVAFEVCVSDSEIVLKMHRSADASEDVVADDELFDVLSPKEKERSRSSAR